MAEAVVQAGLPDTSVASFLTALTAQNETALLLVPGATPQVLKAGEGALKETYSTAFRGVWVSAVGFVALAALGTSADSSLTYLISE